MDVLSRSVCSAVFLFLFPLLPAPFKDTLSPDFVGNPFPHISLQSRWFEAFARCSGGLCADGNKELLNEGSCVRWPC